MLRLISPDRQGRKADSRRPPPSVSGGAGGWVKNPFALQVLKDPYHLRIYQQPGLSPK